MSRKLAFHPLVQKDLNEILEFYEREAGPRLAERFELEFRLALESIRLNPRRFPFYLKQRRHRRCKLPKFPHVILFVESEDSIRIMVLKHVKRAATFGSRRR